MNSVSACGCSPSDQFNMVQDNWAYQSAQLEKTTITGQQNSDIEIRTADGDKVTLSSDINFESSAVTYEKLGRTGTGYSVSRGQIVSVNASSNLELTVEGSLDELERKEIKAVLANLFKMVKDFITGQADPQETQKFTGLTTISEVKADFNIHTRIATAAQFSAEYVEQNPVIERPVIQEKKSPIRPAASDRIDRLTDRMIEVVKDSDIDPARILKRMKKRLSRFYMKFMNEGPADGRKMRLRRQILDDFVKKLKELSAEKEAEITAKDQDDEDDPTRPGEPSMVKTTASISETSLKVAAQDLHFEVEYSVAGDR